ncbi:MAG TPA: DUF1345 domain-containing protein, partial [Pseudolysinimonas sp.]|nr:DUF1345 domain-containing protein [Pseudolysinimonas sp.]
LRLIVMLACGVVAAVAVGLTAGWLYAPISGWVATCAVYLVVVWSRVAGMDEAQTKAHASREDPTRSMSDILTLAASVASLGAVVFLLIGTKDAKGAAEVVVPVLALASVALSWALVHTLFTLRYALLYYSGRDGGIDFNQQEPPRYSDFAYLSFTIGMTYQVSDTDLKAHAVRSTALRQALLSYLFGAIILAATINLLAGLAN